MVAPSAAPSTAPCTSETVLPAAHAQLNADPEQAAKASWVTLTPEPASTAIRVTRSRVPVNARLRMGVLLGVCRRVVDGGCRPACFPDGERAPAPKYNGSA